MKKYLTALLALLLMLQAYPCFTEEPASTPAPVIVSEEAEELNIKAITKYGITIYADVSEDSKVLARTSKGEKITILEFSNKDWVKVKIRYWTGYVLRKHVFGSGITGEEPDVGRTPEPMSDFVCEPSKVEIIPTGIAIGESDTNEVRYNAKARGDIAIRQAPQARAKVVGNVKKGKGINVLAYGDEWCKVQTMNGRITGYCQTKSVYHYHSLDRFKWDIPWHDTYVLNGWAEVTQKFHITDTKNSYKGQDLQRGNILFCNQMEDGTYRTLLRRDWVTIDGDSIIYHPLTPWREAKAGDIIGGYTLFFGLTQGGVYYPHRIANIGTAMSRMNGTEIPSGGLYKFYKNIGPVTTGGGYLEAGITGGSGHGIGGGVCHTSTLMYNVALSLPFFIVEREPHTRDGMTYVPLEFDATVGAYSDFRFINTLPYGVRMLGCYDKKSGIITIRLQCMETVDPEILADWDGSQIQIADRSDPRNK